MRHRSIAGAGASITRLTRSPLSPSADWYLFQSYRRRSCPETPATAYVVSLSVNPIAAHTTWHC